MDSSKHNNIPIKMGDFSVIDSEFNSIRERFDAEMRKMEDEMTRFRSELISREGTPFSQRSSITSRTHRSSEFHRLVNGRQQQSRQEVCESFTSGSNSPTNSQHILPSTSLSAVTKRNTQANARRSFPSMLTQHSAFNSTTQQQQTQQQQQQLKQHSPFSASSALSPMVPDPKTWLDSINSPLIQNEGDQKHLKLRFDVSQYKPEEIVVKTVDNKLMVHAKHEEKTESRSVYREYNREFLLPQGTNPELIKSSLSKDGVLTVEAPLPAALGAAETRLPITQK